MFRAVMEGRVIELSRLCLIIASGALGAAVGLAYGVAIWTSAAEVLR